MAASSSDAALRLEPGRSIIIKTDDAAELEKHLKNIALWTKEKSRRKSREIRVLNAGRYGAATSKHGFSIVKDAEGFVNIKRKKCNCHLMEECVDFTLHQERRKCMCAVD